MIKEVIVNIEKTLKNEKRFNGVGVSNGFLGLSIFCYYQYLYSKDEFYLKETIAILEKSLDMLTNTYKSISPQNDIIETAHYIHFLFQKEVLGNDVEPLLLEFDNLVEEILEERINEGNLDSINGVFKPLSYLFKRKEEHSSQFIKVVKLIEQTAIKEKEYSFWSFTLRSPKAPKVELSLNHGVSGVISGLLDCYENNIEKERVRKLIVSGLQFLEAEINKEEICWFPLEANLNKFSSYQNLFYGDIGVGYVFYKAGKILQEKKWESFGVLVLENAASFRDDSGSYIRDANLIYGASGLYSFFNFINSKTPNVKFQEAKKYWLNKIIEKGKNNTEWAGYDTYYNGAYDFAQVGFSQGICGIGVSLMSDQINNNSDYLEFLNF